MLKTIGWLVVLGFLAVPAAFGCCTSQQTGSTIEKARALFDSRKYDEAARLLNGVAKKDPSYADARFYLGRIAIEQKKFEEAGELLEEAIETNPNVADYHYWLGTAWGLTAQESNVLKQGMLAPKIKEQYEETVRLDPKNMNALWGLVTFYTEAPGFMGGDYEKAFEAASLLSKADAAEGHRARGVIYEKQEKFADAEKAYLAAHRINPALGGQVVALYIGTKQYDKAFNFLEEEYQKDPSNMLVAYQLGRTSAITGQRLARGEECLKKYLTYQPKQNEPSHGGAHMRLGQIYEKRGTLPEAKKSYETALRLDPSLKDAKEGLKRVSK
jgi:cytochrome c-type biogenesis protein CcmH/NrfG